jgi:LacI family transcriptional regulator
VGVDDYKGAYLATEHLINQGYKRIAHVSGQQYLKIFSERLRGYKAALKAHKMPFEKELVFAGNVSIESGKEAVKYFLALPEPPDAIFAVEDFTALGVIKELKENKIKIPEQFGVVGFANEEFDEHITPALTSVDQQTVKMGEEAFNLIMDLVNKKISRTVDNKKVILEPLLQPRASSQR